MARLDRARLENGIFPHRCQVVTRFTDRDQLRHVNNVAVAQMFEEGRYRFIHDTGLIKLPRHQRVIAGTIIEFATDLFHPDPVEVATGILEIGRTSYRYGQIAIQNGRIGAYAEIVQVMRNEQGPVQLPDAWRARLESLKIVPSCAKRAQ